MEIPSESDSNEAAGSELIEDVVAIPRWIVYFQAAMLGIVGATFFVFGVMVGTFGSGEPGRPSQSSASSRIQGLVQFKLQGELRPDSGAVVFLLPDQPHDISRQSPEKVRPQNFQPLENEAIEWISQQGGSVVRANRDGRFELFAAHGSYHLLVVSKAVDGDPPPLMRQQQAVISQYFLPVEPLIGDQHYLWRTLAVEQETVVLEPLIFD